MYVGLPGLGGSKDSKGRGGANGTLNLQHRTSAQGSSHCCTKGHHPMQVRVLYLIKAHTFNGCSLYDIVLIL